MKKNKYLKRIYIITYVIMAVLLCPVTVWAAETEGTSMVENISIESGTFLTEFRPGHTTYSVYFEEFQDPLTVNVQLKDDRFQYAVDGEEFLDRYKDNVVVVDVTDPDGEYADEKYTFNIFFEAIGFSYMGAENGILSPQFDKFHTNYYVVVENEIDTFDKVGLVWHTANKDAVAEVDCVGELNKDGTLPEGERTQYRITVREQDGTCNYYQLFIYRKASMVSALDDTALLENIKINGEKVEVPTFREDQSFYDIIVPSSVTELDIQAYPVDKRNYAEVIGSTIMKEDRPIYITIKVTSEIHAKESYYTLRCQYDTMIHTEKYTELQVSAFVLCALVLGCSIGYGILAFSSQQGKSKIRGERDELIES